MDWSVERTDCLRQMWTDGYSAGQIAGELGGVTRNAVIGKVNRLGLQRRQPKRAGAGRPRCPKEPMLKIRKPENWLLIGYEGPDEKNAASSGNAKRTAREAEVVRRRRQIACEGVDLPAEIGPQPCGVRDLRYAEENGNPPNCHFPVGDPKRAGFHFCGAPAARRPAADHHKRGVYYPWCPYHALMAYKGPHAAEAYLETLRRRKGQQAA